MWPLLSLGLCALLVTPAIADAQGKDTVASGSADSYWNRKRRDFPQCTALVNQHEELTRQLYELDDQAHAAVEPRRKQIAQQINEKAKERSQVQRQLDACTREVQTSSRPSATRLTGGVSDDELGLTRLDPATAAAVRQLAGQLAQAAKDTGTAADEFSKGVMDWARSTLEFLAQKPGVPLGQMAEGIATYLTNNNTANHAMLRKAAEEAVRQFHQNPARFTGQNLPNVLPLPKAEALAQLAKVQAGAKRLLALAANEQRATRAYAGVLAKAESQAARGTLPVAGTGAGDVAKTCFPKNACLNTALAQDLLWRSEEPFVVKGMPHVPAGSDLRVAPDDYFPRLRQHNGPGFEPRNPAQFTAQELDAFKQGSPVPAKDLDQVVDWLRGSGEGSQAILLAEIDPSAVRPGQPPGHFMNIRWEKGAVEVVDNMNLRVDASQVSRWWFFPTR